MLKSSPETASCVVNEARLLLSANSNGKVRFVFILFQRRSLEVLTSLLSGPVFCPNNVRLAFNIRKFTKQQECILYKSLAAGRPWTSVSNGALCINLHNIKSTAYL